MTWTKLSKESHPLLQLAEISARVQRLALITKIHTINSMIAINKPQLQKHPKGRETLKQIEKHTQRLLTQLRTSNPSRKEQTNG